MMPGKYFEMLEGRILQKLELTVYYARRVATGYAERQRDGPWSALGSTPFGYCHKMKA